MQRPDVEPENYNAVFEFARQYKQPAFSRIGYVAVGLRYHPEIVEASGAGDEITELLEDDTHLVIASNHVNFSDKRDFSGKKLKDTDQYVIAGMTHNYRPLAPLQARTRIGSKPELFRTDSAKYRLRRWGVELMGSYAAFREKDIKRNPAYVGDDGELNEAGRQLQYECGEAFVDTSAHFVETGHLSIFPEGTGNRDDPKVVQKVRRGLGETLCRVNPDTKVALVFLGIYYGEGEDFDQRHPTVYVHAPTLVAGHVFEKPDFVSELVQERLQFCVDSAVEHRQHKHAA